MYHLLKDKNILFITTKNLSYIRNRQEISLIRKYASAYTIIGSDSPHYPIRLLSVYLRLLFTSCKGYDTVFVGFAPQLIVPLFHKKFKNAFLIEDFFISLYDTLCYDRKIVKAASILGRLLRTIDSYTLRPADKILCDTKAHGNYFISALGADEKKMHTLYLQADIHYYYPRKNSLKPAWLQNRYVVLYFGSMLPLQGIDIVLSAINLLKENKQIYFYCIGPIKENKLTVPKPHSPQIEYINWLSQTELAEYISLADLCLAGHFNGQIAKAKRTIPGKAFIYQAMKKSMILGDNPANRERFSESPSVSFVEMGNPSALAEMILQKMKEIYP